MRLSRSHPISLPHSGELFVIGCSRRKWKANIFRIGWDRTGQSGRGLRSIPVGLRISQQFLLCWQSGRFPGGVVPWWAADSLLHRGEVLCLAEFSAHTRHIGTAQVNTETLRREESAHSYCFDDMNIRMWKSLKCPTVRTINNWVTDKFKQQLLPIYI